MGNPASRPEFGRTCPACSGPVEPGYKFCKICGTPIPELLTCSKCGTQFTHPDKFCDLCGAPLILEILPGPESDETPEHYDNEIPGQDTDKIEESEVEVIPEPAEEETPQHNNNEIPEPDTDELLEQYGKEYDEDETLESFHKPKPTSPIHHEAKKPVSVPALHGRESSGTVDDVLFLPDKEPVTAKPLVNKIRIVGGGMVLISILVSVFFIGLPMITGNGGFSTHSNVTAAEITPGPGTSHRKDNTANPGCTAFPCSCPPANTADTHRPEVLLPGPEKPDYFKDLGNFHRKCGGGRHQQCGYQGHSSRWIDGNRYHSAPQGCDRYNP